MPWGKPYPFLRMLGFPFLFPLIIAQLVWFIRSTGVQIVNIHYPMDSLSYFALCRRLLPVRLVTSIHGSDVFPDGKPRRAYSQAFKFLMRASDLVVLPSETYRKRILGIFPKCHDKTVAIHNGVSPEQFKPAVTRRPATAEFRYLLSIAALVEWKGIDILLRGAKPLLDEDPSLRLAIVGEGPLRSELAALSSALGIDRQTEFLGKKDAAEIATLLHNCEVFVHCSRAEVFRPRDHRGAGLQETGGDDRSRRHSRDHRA